MPDKNPTLPQYDENQINNYNRIDHVRRRPGMYFGGTDRKALHHLIDEIIASALEEVLAGKCTQISVTLYNASRISISDNGLGIPVEIYEDTGQSVLELIMMDKKGRYDRGLGRFWGGMMYVGLSSVSALCAEFKIEVRRDGFLWEQTYREGQRATDLIKVRPLEAGESTGTTLTLHPDFTIMEVNEFSYELLAYRLCELAFLNTGLTTILRDERLQSEGENKQFRYEHGVADYLVELRGDVAPLHSLIHIQQEQEIQVKAPFTVNVDIAFQYVEHESFSLLSYANTVPTTDGGTHVKGFLEGLKSFVAYQANKSGFDRNFSQQDITAGLIGIVNIRHPYPAFESQTKVRLLNPEMEAVIYRLVFDTLEVFAARNPDAAQSILDKCLENKRQRDQRISGES